MSIDGDFKSRGYGFVQFETLEAAQKAIKEMHGKDVAKKVDGDEAAAQDEVVDPVDAGETESTVLSVVEYVPK